MEAMTAVIITVMGPVGSEISRLQLPKIAANKPTKTAPIKPDFAPAPEATPNAKAKGREIIAVVTPPARSGPSFLKEGNVKITHFLYDSYLNCQSEHQKCIVLVRTYETHIHHITK